MSSRSSLPVILFLDPYLTAKVQARAMDAAKILEQNVTDAALILHVLTVFFQHEREILELLYPTKTPDERVPEERWMEPELPPV